MWSRLSRGSRDPEPRGSVHGDDDGRPAFAGRWVTFVVVELVDLPRFGPDEYAQIVDGELDPFGTEHLAIEWGPKTDHVGLKDDDRLIGHAGWVRADMKVATGKPIEVLGLGGVMLHRGYRGRGVGRVLVEGAMQQMEGQGTTIAILFCRPERMRFYGDLGWHPLVDSVTVGQPGGPIVMPLRTCWLALADGAIVPSGDLEFPGLPF